MNIIDAHAHVFPYMGSEAGWGSVAARMANLQEAMYGYGKLPDINFRVGRFGRFEWTEGGIDYYRQYMPPSLQDQVASPEFMIAQMDHAGVDMAVLQNAKVYGKLNHYFADCVRNYPDRFVGLAEINELEADKESEIRRLRDAIKGLRLRGLFYEASWLLRAEVSFNDARFDVFWREVSDLRIPVVWQVVSGGMPAELYMKQMRQLSAFADRFPDIASIVMMGLFAQPFRENDGVRFPEELLAIFRKPNIFAEIVYPISAGPLGWDYPFPQAQELIKQQYEELGAQKLIWGSDMPNVERNCTYRQSLCYLKDYCDFIDSKDMALILGGNIARILKIEEHVPKTTKPRLVI